MKRIIIFLISFISIPAFSEISLLWGHDINVDLNGKIVIKSNQDKYKLDSGKGVVSREEKGFEYGLRVEKHQNQLTRATEIQNASVSPFEQFGEDKRPRDYNYEVVTQKFQNSELQMMTFCDSDIFQDGLSLTKAPVSINMQCATANAKLCEELSYMVESSYDMEASKIKGLSKIGIQNLEDFGKKSEECTQFFRSFGRALKFVEIGQYVSSEDSEREIKYAQQVVKSYSKDKTTGWSSTKITPMGEFKTYGDALMGIEKATKIINTYGHLCKHFPKNKDQFKANNNSGVK